MSAWEELKRLKRLARASAFSQAAKQKLDAELAAERQRARLKAEREQENPLGLTPQKVEALTEDRRKLDSLAWLRGMAANGRHGWGGW